MASWNDVRMWQERPRQFLQEATGDKLAREARTQAGGAEGNQVARLWCEASNWLRKTATPGTYSPRECYC